MTAERGARCLDGRTALVSGASSGIGYATAGALAEAGANVVITEVPERRAAAETAAASLEHHGSRVLSAVVDVRDVASIRACVARCLAELGPVDILVNNAGTNARKPALEVTEDDWDSVVDVNLRGTFFLSQEVARHMVERRCGKIVNVASIYGLVGGESRVPYAASKAGLVNLTRCLALEWAPHNIQVNAVAPTFALTPLTERLFADRAVLDEVLGRTPARRLAKVEEVAAAVLYLVSPAADIVTGTTIALDGGWTAQ